MNKYRRAGLLGASAFAAVLAATVVGRDSDEAVKVAVSVQADDGTTNHDPNAGIGSSPTDARHSDTSGEQATASAPSAVASLASGKVGGSDWQATVVTRADGAVCVSIHADRGGSVGPGEEEACGPSVGDGDSPRSFRALSVYPATSDHRALAFAYGVATDPRDLEELVGVDGQKPVLHIGSAGSFVAVLEGTTFRATPV